MYHFANRGADYALHDVRRKAGAGILRIVAAERRVLEYPNNAIRQGGRMQRYVPKGIVGALTVNNNNLLK
jgi:hypothetical protein